MFLVALLMKLCFLLFVINTKNIVLKQSWKYITDSSKQKVLAYNYMVPDLYFFAGNCLRGVISHFNHWKKALM